MKKTFVLLGLMAMAFSAYVSTADAGEVTFKVKFSLSGYYYGESSSSSNTVRGTTIQSQTETFVPFKITEADVLATYGKTVKNAYLTVLDPYSPTQRIVLISGTNTPIPVMTLALPAQVWGTSWKSVKAPSSSSEVDSTTIYLSGTTSIDGMWGVTNRDSLGTSIISLDLHAGGVETGGNSEYLKQGTRPRLSSTGTLNLSLVGLIGLIPPHKLTETVQPKMGVVTSGSLTANLVPVK